MDGKKRPMVELPSEAREALTDIQDLKSTTVVGPADSVSLLAWIDHNEKSIGTKLEVNSEMESARPKKKVWKRRLSKGRI